MEEDKNKQRYVTVEEVSVQSEEGRQPRPRLKRHASAQTVIQTDDWWLWELAGILISLAALVGIGALLSVLNDRPQPSWAYTAPARTIGSKSIPAVTVAVSPNSVLSLLSTLARICVLIPITKGLAQLKWVWFAERERQLSDFEAFDNARTVTGSLLLVWKLRFRHLAVVGAFGILLSLAFDPFVQNLLSYYSKNVVDSSIPALLPRAIEYVGGNRGATLNPEMKAAVIAGFSHAPNFNVPDYTCASGNCTWQDVPTLGVCSRCSDVSSLLVRQCNSTNITLTGSFQRCRFSLPNGFFVDASPDPTTNVLAKTTANDWLGGGLQSLVFANYSSPISRMWSIFADASDVDDYASFIKVTTKVYATECALVPCIQLLDSSVGSRTSSVGRGVTTLFNEVITAEYDVYKNNDTQAFAFSGEVDNSMGSWLQPNNILFGNESYHMSADSQQQLTKYLGETLPGVVTSSIEIGNEPFFNLPDGSDSLFMQNVFTANPAKTCNRNIHSEGFQALRFQCAIENMATSMTVALRNGISKMMVVSSDPSAKQFLTATGSTMISETYIAVTWYWLVLPILIWVLAVIMFVGTVWKTRQAGVRTWRTSTLAPLFLGLGIGDEKKHKVEQIPMTADGLQRKAEEIKVQLHLTNQEMKLVGE